MLDGARSLAAALLDPGPGGSSADSGALTVRAAEVESQLVLLHWVGFCAAHAGELARLDALQLRAQ